MNKALGGHTKLLIFYYFKLPCSSAFPEYNMGMDILHDAISGPPSPSKGKGTDANNKTWRTGWWDFYPLLERPKRYAHVVYEGL